jgi:NADPH:quinone reductase-like Zn-dependent oxidoreductase
MRALCLTATGGPNQLKICDIPKPGPIGKDEVRIRIKRIALNHLDLFVAEGLPNVPIKEFPHPVGADGAGLIIEVGDDVVGINLGDRVVINPGLSCGDCEQCRRHNEVYCQDFGLLGEHRGGTAAEELVIPARNVLPIEGEWSWEEAAAFSLTTLTAWRMLTSRAQVREGETVLIWGIGGGVAVQALQIVRHLGARAVVTSSSDKKLEHARSLGAELCLNHASVKEIPRAVKEHFGGGVDVVVDSVGSATWQHSLRALKPGGRLVTCGATSGHEAALDLRKLFWFQWSLLGSTMGTSKEFSEIVALGNRGLLRPVVDRTYPLEDAIAAYQRLAGGEQFGKIALTVEEGDSR